MSTSPLSTASMFSGNSRFSTDFQQVISRAVSIASLPMSQMQSGLSTLQAQSSELGTVSTKLTAIQTAITGIESSTGAGSYAATVSDKSVSTTLGATATEGTFTVEVVSLGSYNNTMSKDGLLKVANPATDNLSATSDFTLTTSDGSSSLFQASNLSDLVDKINSSGLSVQASMVNVGSTSSPDYRLSIQGTKLGGLGISLTDGGVPTATQFLSTIADGAEASYKVNGYATAASSDTRSVEIAPGVTVNLLAETGTNPVSTVTVTRNTDATKFALSSFITAYNAAIDELTKNRGSGGGALTGQGIVYSVDDALSTMQSYSPGSGTLTSLEDIGVKVDKTGKLSLDSTVFDKNAAANPDALMTFLGSSTTGGFLKTATDTLTSLDDSTNGIVSIAQQSVSSQMATQTSRISEEQDRITNLQTSLNAQMAAADAAIAALEQQANYLSQLFASMETNNALYSK